MAPITLARQVVGWAEWVQLEPGQLVFQARIDSGAGMSSLHCAPCVIEQRAGEDWVRLTLQGGDGQRLTIERPIRRWLTIKRHFGAAQRRPVISLGICLAGVYREVEVNLVDRTGLTYPLLIGRDFLQAAFLIDPAATFLTYPDCQTE